MNLEAIAKVLSDETLPDEGSKVAQILKILAEDPQVIPNLMLILQHERSSARALLVNTNSELSKAIAIMQSSAAKEDKDIKWCVEEIKAHYRRNAGKISCCFNIEL